ncbi:MAG TPA: NAD(P)-dependent oxidoreductase [Anaerolineales bacterium]|nr:NAD(P)-dependent oxidoreductase [Anaerolineales bacterium]
MRFKIFIATPFPTSALQMLMERADLEYQPNISQTSLEKRLSKYDALIIGSNQYLSEDAIVQSERLRVLALAGSEQRGAFSLTELQNAVTGLEVVSVPNTHATAQAEQTFLLLLHLAQQHHKILQGATLGIVGFGTVGLEVAQRAQAFGMRVLVNQPRLTPQLALQAGVESRDLLDLLAEADFVCVLVPGNPFTKHLLNKQNLSNRHEGLFLVNNSNSQAISTQALFEALQNGQVTSAAVTLTEQETATWSAQTAQAELPTNLFVYPRLHAEDSSAQTRAAEELAQLTLERLTRLCEPNSLGLRIVPMERVFPHEHYDEKRVHALAQRIQQSDVFTNPPIVCEWQGNYVVLDGATRSTACRTLGFRHLVVQVFSPEDKGVQLETWNHAIRQVNVERLLTRLMELPNLQVVESTPEAVRRAVTERTCIAGLLLSENRAYQVHPTPQEPAFAALNRLVEVYTGLGLVARTTHTTYQGVLGELADAAMLVLFAPFDIEQVLQAGISQELFPAGITRFVVPGRVLRVNAPKGVLLSELSLERKNSWLNRFLIDRMQVRNPRYYQEPILLLDE